MRGGEVHGVICLISLQGRHIVAISCDIHLTSGTLISQYS